MRFFSDNAAPVCPEVLDAIVAANAVDTAYDGDALSRSLDEAFSTLFEAPVAALWVSTGTAANALALAALCPPAAQRTPVGAPVDAERPPNGPSRPAVDLLDECRDAVRVLGERADPADSAAYRQWVQSIAARVCTAGRGPAAGQLGPGDRHFLADLGHALGMV